METAKKRSLRNIHQQPPLFQKILPIAWNLWRGRESIPIGNSARLHQDGGLDSKNWMIWCSRLHRKCVGISCLLSRSIFQILFEFICNHAEPFNRVIHLIQIPQLTHFLGNAPDSVRVGFWSQFHCYPPQASKAKPLKYSGSGQRQGGTELNSVCNESAKFISWFRI